MESQLALVKGKAFNPRLVGGGDSIEFTYDFTSARGADRPIENIREFQTIGGSRKKQAETDKYRITLSWYEPNDNVPERIYAARDYNSDRAQTFTYIHSDKIIGRALAGSGEGSSLTVYIANFRARRAGRNEFGQDSYFCELTIQEI